MAKIVDPDQLNQETEVTIHSGERKVQLSAAGNLNNASPGQSSGVTHQAVYSFLKEEWMNDANLNKYKFPIKPLTKFKFDWQNDWNLYDEATRNLIRDGGWKEVDSRENTCIISLGDFHADSDQAYYQRVTGFDQTTLNFDKTGALNEAYMSYSGEAGKDYTDFLKLYLRIQGKLFTEGNLIVDQGWPSIEYDAYRVPLSNALDPNITAEDDAISGEAPYTGMEANYIPGTDYETYDYGEVPYAAQAIVFSGETPGGRWYQALTSTSDAPPHADWLGGGAVYGSFSGEREIGSGEFYAFNRILTGNNATNQEIYEWAQFWLRQSGELNADTDLLGYGSVYGKVAVPLLSFVGTTLVTNPGVFIDGYNVNYKNAIEFYDITVDGGLDSEDVPVSSTKRTFPFVSAGTMKFNAALTTDGDAHYWMYFSDANGNVFDSDNAICVEDENAIPISGEINGSGEIDFSFAYTTNVQGGRTQATNANVVLVGMGLFSGEWISGDFTITEATGLEFPITSPDERNYDNP